MKARVIVGLLVCLGLAAWAMPWALARLDDTSQPDPSAKAGAIDAHLAPSPPEPLPAQERTAATAAGALTPDTARPLRLVVVHPDGTRAAGAEVRYWPLRSQTQRAHHHRLVDKGGDLEAALRATGRVATTDARGCVAIEVDPDSDVCARSGSTYAQAFLALFDHPAFVDLWLELRPDVTVRIQVVDAQGQGRAGIAVAAQARADARHRGPCSEEFEFPVTDAGGHTLLRHAQEHLPMPSREIFEWKMTVHWRNGDTAGQREVTAEDLTNEAPIRLLVPLGGTVVAKLVDADGKPWPGRAELIGTDSEQAFVADDRDERAGLSYFRQVPLDKRWQLEATPDGSLVQHFVGPTRSDEVVEVSMQVPQRMWDIRGRIVDGDGKPVFGAKVALASRGTPEEVELSTTGQGEFRLWGQRPQSVVAIDDLVVRVQHAMLSSPLAIRIDRVLRPGLSDLGDLVVPVPQDLVLLATVEARHEGQVITSRAWAGLREAGGRDTLKTLVVARFRGDLIELRGRIPEKPMELRCGADGFLPSLPVPIQRGDHRIVELQRANRLRIPIVPPAIPVDTLRAELKSATDVDTTGLGNGYSFQWDWLARGTYSLRITAGGRVLHEVPQLVIDDADVTWPATGDRLDLRACVRAIHLHIRPADPAHVIEQAWAYAVPAGTTSAPADLDSRLLDYASWFVPQEQPTDVLVNANGFVPVRVPNPTTDTSVTLVRCTTLSISGPVGADVRATTVQQPMNDPLLRAIATWPTELEWTCNGNPQEPAFPPGTVLEFTVARNAQAGPPQRVVVGTTSPQIVLLQ